jgi:ATP-binding cassette subfamily C (CFTR/MRP) protein 1
MTLANTFTIIAILQKIEDPARALPGFFTFFIEFIISMKRIQDFLLCPEVNPSIITRIRSETNTAVSISGGNFHWGGESQTKKDDDEKKEEESKAAAVALDEESAPALQNSTQTVENMMALKGLDINVKKGEFVCIIGDVGSGKSSLLSSLIGEMNYMDGK